MRYLLLLFMLHSWQSSASNTEPCTEGPQCVAQQQLHLSMALGYGQRSNPLHGGKELSLVVLPEIYYYSEHWFFDNGILGSSMALSDNVQLSVLGQLNQEKGYFKKWFSGNVLQFNTATVGPALETAFVSRADITLQQVNKRPTAFDLGVQLDWFSDTWQAQAALWQDISNSYNGQHASISLNRGWQKFSSSWQLSLRLYWKSAKLIDTYYGIDDNEALFLPRYNGKPSWQPELRLNWQKPLSERVSLLAFVRYLHLDDAMTQSPLVRSDKVTTWFLGVSYRFY
ncbi:MipA/OmpV family protein [Rheinheimera maricola]|uniref:MipA/OmpV family protein n=1 Tax=Rheinheimera maricola TaxID=2793282 RepID=A0ABS7XD69_9GAMM|nr:MipA/OmpV family protein [Rheinheimera maricola]MBZ9613508.1 MipA/OmpV family protein [Rheinheimera maricola]